MGILKSNDDKIFDEIKKLRIEVRQENKETRAHIAAEVATVAGDLAHTKNFMSRLLTAVKKLLNKMGIATDDL